MGCVGYWLLTGQLVFDAGTTVGMLTAHVISQPAPPSQRVDLPIAPELERIVLDCLQKDPAHRPASAEVLREALGRVPVPEPWSRERATAWWAEHVPARRLLATSTAP